MQVPSLLESFLSAGTEKGRFLKLFNFYFLLAMTGFIFLQLFGFVAPRKPWYCRVLVWGSLFGDFFF